VFEAFPNTFPEKRSAQHVGNPVRNSIVNLIKQIKPKSEKRILIVGGSLGAMTLNNVVPASLSGLSEQPQIWHQTGQRDLEQTKDRYKEVGIEARVEAFLDDIDQAYAWADLVICRAGALTVSELAAAGLPAVLVPYPYAVDDHQTANAHYLADAGAAIIIQDSDLTKEKLASVIEEWISSPELISDMSSKSREMAMTGATEEVGESIMEVAYG